jgi:hypothetical protein
MMRVRKQGEYVLRTVLYKIYQHQLNSLRIDIGCNNKLCPCRKRNCKRPDTGKHIEDGLMAFHLFKNALPL